MATRQGRQSGHNRTRQDQRQTSYRNAYVYGNTVRKPDVKRAMEEEPRRRLSNETRKNRDKARHMNLGYVTFLFAALLVAGFVLVNYIQLQSDITNSVKQIAALESRLNNLKQENDEEYSRLMSSVDLEEIKRVAIGELGMTYAAEEQVITFTNEGSDYVRQYADIPK